MAGFAVTAGLDDRSACAATIAAHLDYDAAPGCPLAADFEAIVAGRLGYSPFREDASERILVRIAASGRFLEGRFEWWNDTGRWAGERTFPSRSGDCAELARAMGFALALQFQLLASTETPTDPPREPPAAERALSPLPPIVNAPPAPAATSEAARAAPSRLSFTAGAGATAGFGLAPDVSALGRVFGTVAWPHAALELAAEVSIPSTSRRQDGAGFSHQIILASLAGCGLLARWSGCLLAKVGELRVVGDAVDVPRSSFGVLVQMGARVGVTQMIGRRVHVALHGDGLVLLTRGVVRLDATPVWTTPLFAALVGLDLGIRFQ